MYPMEGWPIHAVLTFYVLLFICTYVCTHPEQLSWENHEEKEVFSMQRTMPPTPPSPSPAGQPAGEWMDGCRAGEVGSGEWGVGGGGGGVGYMCSTPRKVEYP